jgi:RNA polymerase sigma-70 factor, ECF subfamily
LDRVNSTTCVAIVSHEDACDDVSLVLRAIDGDHDAFETLLSRHKMVVLRVARRLTTDIDAEDVTQQCFLKAFINLSGFRFKSSFRTWLLSIALNEARMWRRKAQRHRTSSMTPSGAEEDQAPTFDCPDSSPGPEMRYSDDEWNQLLYSAIGRLKPLERAAVRTCDLKGISLADAALILGISVSALKSRRSRGRATLRKYLLRHLSIQPLLST